jgi:hypothetical protein
VNSFLEQLQRLVEQVRRRQPHIRGEESTKQALIVPFLSLLGYDVHDPTELQPEYVADFAKKRPGGPAEKVDYAIRRDGNPVIFVECKSVDCVAGEHAQRPARALFQRDAVGANRRCITNGHTLPVLHGSRGEEHPQRAPLLSSSTCFDFTTNDAEVLEYLRARTLRSG